MLERQRSFTGPDLHPFTTLSSIDGHVARPRTGQPWYGAEWQNSVHALAQRGDNAGLAALLQSDPSTDLDARDSQNVTALHWAAINAHIATCRFLLDSGADVDPVGGDLMATPLQWAARNGHLYVVHLLLSRGADPNSKDTQGFNTLHLITHSSAVMPVLYMVS